ncbi:MAG: hypothetical protein M0R03_23595 [Novosphingobium sp.]|jgi:hypothetical protein|nr:hypothetical protein [Novosphingobium sp.]
MNDKELADAIHMEIHAVRRIPNYKASIMERNVSRLVLERFSEECKECKEIQEKIKSQPEQKKGFFNKIKEVID